MKALKKNWCGKWWDYQVFRRENPPRSMRRRLKISHWSSNFLSLRFPLNFQTFPLLFPKSVKDKDPLRESLPRVISYLILSSSSAVYANERRLLSRREMTATTQRAREGGGHPQQEREVRRRRRCSKWREREVPATRKEERRRGKGRETTTEVRGRELLV